MITSGEAWLQLPRPNATGRRSCRAFGHTGSISLEMAASPSTPKFVHVSGYSDGEVEYCWTLPVCPRCGDFVRFDNSLHQFITIKERVMRYSDA